MRVLYVTDAPLMGGAERSLVNLLTHLSAEVEPWLMGADPGVVARIAEARPGIRTVPMAAVRSKRDLRGLVALRSAIRSVRPDLLHVSLTGPRSCRFALAAALLPPRIPVVAVEQLPTAPATPWQRWWRRRVHARLGRHVAVGVGSARELEAHLGLGRGEVTTVHNGVPVPAHARARRTTARPVVGTLSRLDPQKGLDGLLRATASLDVDLRIIGEGPLRAELEDLAAALGSLDRVTFTGWTDDPGHELAQLDLFVLASKSEGFPLAIVEAMLMGLPVVATAVGSVQEAVEHDITGLLVPPDDEGALRAAIASLANDQDRRSSMGAAGRERARASFTAPAMAQAFEAIYRETAAR